MLIERLEWFNKNCLYLLIITAFLGPSFLVFEFGPVHLFPFRFLWLFLFALTLIYFCIKKSAFGFLNKSRSLFYFLLIWLIYAALSLAWAADMTGAIRQILFLLIGISVIFMAALYWQNLKDYQVLQVIWVFSLFAISMIGLWNVFSGEQLSLSKFAGTSGHRPTAVFVNPNDFATFLTLSLPFLITYIRYSKLVLIKIGCSGLALVALMLCLSTGSRLNLIALFFGAIIWFFLLADKKAKINSLLVAGSIVLLIMVLFFFLPEQSAVLFDTVMGSGTLRIMGFLQNVLEGEVISGVSIPSRINYFRNGYQYLLNTYGFGIGAGQAEYYLSNYQYYDTFGYKNLHNWWLEIAVNYGFLIILGFFWYYVSLLINLYRTWQNGIAKASKMISEALLLSLVIFFFASMSSSSLFAFGPLWALFAFATGFVNMSLNTIKEES